MNGGHKLTDQDKMDCLAKRILNTKKPSEAPPAPTKADLERPFRISFRNGQPVFEEVED